MGKRKKAKAPPKKAKPKVSTVFSCPFCGGGDTCSVKLDREHKLGTITCSACQAKYTKEITPLDEAIDVYSEWIDMCAAPPAARCASPCIIACIACACRAIRLPPPPTPLPPPLPLQLHPVTCLTSAGQPETSADSNLRHILKQTAE